VKPVDKVKGVVEKKKYNKIRPHQLVDTASPSETNYAFSFLKGLRFSVEYYNFWNDF
jgi:hypothetical protein